MLNTSSKFLIIINKFFLYNYWQEIVKYWYQIGVQMELPISKNYSFSNSFVNTDEVRLWSLNGLPTDPLSVDNYAIILKTIHTPLIIDPQGISISYLVTLDISNACGDS